MLISSILRLACSTSSVSSSSILFCSSRDCLKTEKEKWHTHTNSCLLNQMWLCEVFVPASGDIILQLLNAFLVLFNLSDLLLDLGLSITTITTNQVALFVYFYCIIKSTETLCTSVSIFFLSSRSRRSWSAFWSLLNFSSSWASVAARLLASSFRRWYALT